jgi:uncharacterized protein (TIGR03083 family)
MASAVTTRIDFVEEFAAAAERFAVTLAGSQMSASVPACPGWVVYDLARHVANTHSWAATIVETGRSAPEQNDAPTSRRPRAVCDWYAGKAEDLYEVLRAADPTAPCWNFARVNETAGFWSRRQTHETLVHLVDLDQAHGRDTELSPEVCTDGVAEVFEVFLPRMHARGYVAQLTAPLMVRTLDTDHVWTLTPRHDAPPHAAVRTEPGADLIEGSAADLLRVLWKRLPADAVAWVGNHERIGAFLAGRLTS